MRPPSRSGSAHEYAHASGRRLVGALAPIHAGAAHGARRRLVARRLPGPARRRLPRLGAAGPRLLDQRAFGELGLLATTLNLCATLAGLGLGTATTKFMAEWRVRDPARAGRVLGLTLRWAATGGLITLALVALAAPALARWGLAAAHLTDAVRLTALMIPLATLNGVQISALYGLEAFRTLAWTNLATAALAVAGPPVGAWLGGLPGAVLGQLAAQVVYVTASQVALRREVRRAGLRVVYDAPPGERADLLRFSGPTLLATLLVLPPTWLSQSLVAHGPDGHHELALLTAASQLQMVMLFLSGTLGAQILPLLANVDAGRDPRTYQRALLLQYGLNGVVTAGAGLAIWLAAPLLLGLYGDAFARGRNLLALLLASALCMAVAGVAGKGSAQPGPGVDGLPAQPAVGGGPGAGHRNPGWPAGRARLCHGPSAGLRNPDGRERVDPGPGAAAGAGPAGGHRMNPLQVLVVTCGSWYLRETARAYQERGALAGLWISDKNSTGVDRALYRRCWPFHLAMKPFYHLCPGASWERYFWRTCYPLWQGWVRRQRYPDCAVVHASQAFATEPFDWAERHGALKVFDAANSYGVSSYALFRQEWLRWNPGRPFPGYEEVQLRSAYDAQRADLILCPSPSCATAWCRPASRPPAASSSRSAWTCACSSRAGPRPPARASSAQATCRCARAIPTCSRPSPACARPARRPSWFASGTLSPSWPRCSRSGGAPSSTTPGCPIPNWPPCCRPPPPSCCPRSRKASRAPSWRRWPPACP
jgi:hypothetical protein